MWLQGCQYMVQELMLGGDLHTCLGEDPEDNRQFGWYRRWASHSASILLRIHCNCMHADSCKAPSFSEYHFKAAACCEPAAKGGAPMLPPLFWHMLFPLIVLVARMGMLSKM